MKIIYLVVLILWVVLLPKVSMSNSNQICFLPEPGDTNSFGSSVAINNKYLAVGDPRANRLVIYQRDRQGQWRRNREIYPPENSAPYKIGNGFGRNLRLDKNTLMVDALSTPLTKNVDLNNLVPSFFGQYFIQLDREQEVTPINVPAEKKEGFVQFYILSEDKPKLVTIPDNNEELFAASGVALNNFAVHDNLLLIGSPSRHIGGKGWLFDLKADNQLIELTTENAHLGDTVALSEQFAVVGNGGTRRFIQDDIEYPKTLIRSLENGSTVVVDRKGELSLDGNILAVMLPPYRLLMQSPQLQLFRLDEDAVPHLILERKSSKDAWHFENKYLSRAWVQNGWLITVNSIDEKGSVKLCLESIEQIISK